MPNQNKPKITIDADGTIHVDNREDRPRSTAQTTSNKSDASNPSARTSSSSTPLKTAAQLADEELSASSSTTDSAMPSKTEPHTSTSSVGSRSTSQPAQAQPPHKKKSIPDSVMLLLVGAGMLFLGIFVWPDIWMIGVGIFGIVVAFICDEWH